MALKRGEVSLVVIVCFFAWSYVVRWIPTLRWVSYAFITGLVLPVIGFIALLLFSSRKIPCNERSSIRRPRAAAFLEPVLWKNELAALRSRQIYEKKPLCAKFQLLPDALDEIINLLIRDFINSWYSMISNDPVFINEIDNIIRIALTNLCDRHQSLDLTAVLTTRFMPILTAHFRNHYDAEKAIRGKHLNRTVTESDELDLAIAAKYNHGKLHPAASLSCSDTKLAQQAYLRGVVKNILPQLLSQSILSSQAANTLIGEMVVCTVLSPIIQLLVEPDTWNQLIESYGRPMLQDRSTVRKIRFALDQHALPTCRMKRIAAFPRIAPGDHERKFEKFINAITKLNNLSDARRFRSEVSSLLKKKTLDLKDPIYLRRLHTGKKLLDERVNQLAIGEDKSSCLQESYYTGISKLEAASLVDLLHDTSGLTYFMEYMDRQNLMSLVQFWIVVDGFRTPLEDDFIDDDITETLLPCAESDRADLAQIFDFYFPKSELRISVKSKQTVQEFLNAGKNASPRQYYLARKEILRAQTAVLDVMQEKYFEDFKNSDLFYKCLTSQEAMKTHRQARPLLKASGSESNIQKNHLSPLMPSIQTSSGKSLAASKAYARNSSKHEQNRRQFKSSLDLVSINNDQNSNSFAAGVVNPSSMISDEDEFENDVMINSTYSLDQEIDKDVPDKNVVKAMEAAFNIIMEDKSNVVDLQKSLFGDEDYVQTRNPPRNVSSSGKIYDDNQANLFGVRSEKTEKVEKPNISSLGLVNVSSRIGVFTDDDLFPDEEKFISDEHEDPEEDELDQDEQVHEAAPGDLGLAEVIAQLSSDIERLEAQDAVVDSMTRKAELTNNAAELRVLKKSKTSLQREIRHKELQRRQYVVQESDNSLYGRSSIKITSILVGKEEDGREYAVYVIEVQRKAGEQIPAATWNITRRYSEFLELHQKLREKYISIQNSNFPRRRMVMKLQSEFLQKRRQALESYLREILMLPEVCRSKELRTFLSESVTSRGDGNFYENDKNKKDRVTRLYNSITDGMEDILGNIPVLDQISVAGHNIISAATQQHVSMPAIVGEDRLIAAEAEAELNAFENRELEPFIKPICDIFLEIFDLNRSNNWLRGRAVVAVLHQLFGGTIERKVREFVRGIFCEDSLIRYISLIRNSIWPEGKLKIDSKPRSASEKSKSKIEASFILIALVPDLAASVVGRVNAQAASRRISAMLNNSRLNVHLFFTLFDEMIDVIFEEKSV